MDGHLRSDWVELCLMPHNVRKESWDKFTACLLGDEKMNDEEFAEWRGRRFADKHARMNGVK